MKQSALTGTTKTFLNPIPATKNVTVRKSVYDLNDAEVLALREAYAKLQAINDNRGYQYVASVHGLNQYYCPHGLPAFLIWHRPYVLMFEMALQNVHPGMGLPYWDWTSDKAIAEGLPKIFTDATYKDPKTGKDVPNPLLKAAISYPNTQKLKETYRDPAKPASLSKLRTQVQAANRLKTYDEFRPAAESPHNGLHGWVGGTMGDISYAAFDPVFWVHHCYVEKLFCDWQDRYGAPIPPDIAGQVQAPFNKTTEQLWDYKALGYRYAPEGAHLMLSNRADVLLKAVKATTRVTTFDLTQVPPNFETAKLRFTKAQHPLDSMEVRVFFNVNDANAKTKTEDNPNFAGSLHLFGHGGCTGDPGHCAVPEVPDDATHFAVLRNEHHLKPMLLSIDVTDSLRKIEASKTAKGKLNVDVVFVDPKGNELPVDSLDFEMLTLDVV